ncbi:MAG: DEAD/DEAH box helicase [Myxococcales bacterium]|nr:DEAD/DEAH box helicase [Myxococcales bacterium]
MTQAEALRWTELAMRAFRLLAVDTQHLGVELGIAGSVWPLRLDPSGHVVGVVMSSRGRGTYRVDGRLSDDLRCTCSWRHECKHVAAVLFMIATKYGGSELAHGGSSSPDSGSSASAALERWLASWTDEAAPQRERLVLLLHLEGQRLFVDLGSQHLARNGVWSQAQPITIAGARRVISGEQSRQGLDGALDSLVWDKRAQATLTGRLGGFGLQAALATERLVLSFRGDSEVRQLQLVPGPPRIGKLGWLESDDGVLRTGVDLGDPAILVLPLVPAYYVDTRDGSTGEIRAARDVAKWLAAPEIRAEQVPSLARTLEERGMPAPKTTPIRVVEGLPQVRFVIFSEELPNEQKKHLGRLEFRYQGVLAPAEDEPEKRTLLEVDGEKIALVRDLDAEEDAMQSLESMGFMPESAEDHWSLPDAFSWGMFQGLGVPFLENVGIEVVYDPSYALQIVESVDYFTDLEPSGNDWFELDFGVDVQGERISLLPMLLQGLAEGADLGGEGEAMLVELPSGRLARVEFDRIRPLVDILLELAVSDQATQRRISRWQALELAETLGVDDKTGKALRELRASLTSGALSRPKLPKSFRGTLRDYQAQGVAWLGLLGKHGVGAVLADDMGLGKTVQLLAHLVARKHKKLAKGPSLVVAPTSVLVSWSEQIQQFAPKLDVLLWHGPERQSREAELSEADLVLTSYSLLHRDQELLTPIPWDVAILDEAQAIKNPKTATAHAARKLEARQRIAVTGTPLENHLGEVWSQFAFAVPGALGSERAFAQAFRNPIEKEGDDTRMAALRRRIAPLLLRRTKEDVAKELPPKTVITHHVELGTAQRDLYETVRKLVDKQVREEIARRGMALSRIAVLDALLKLRQVCCDPSLVKSKQRRQVPSAKRRFLSELLETMLSEGRRILIFSQFVEMLVLIREDLLDAGVPYAYLTGSTVNRKTQIELFQSGDVPIFLISLKAGGVGLNLTAADTVIHYDPWWNPAAEAQATDRAHRIGQDKPVFVHRLIARGTVEEKIVALQAKKAELAGALLSGGTRALDLDEALLDDLLAPLGG